MVKTGGMSIFYLDLFSRHDLMTQIDTAASEWTPRGDVILTMIRKNFCQFARKEIRGCVEEMLGSGRLESGTGKKRINDEVTIRFAIFKAQAIEPTLRILDLSGRPVAAASKGDAGLLSTFSWDGLSENGSLVAPGTYLGHIELGTLSGDDEMLFLITVAY